jgi:hypothetical protein
MVVEDAYYDYTHGGPVRDDVEWEKGCGCSQRRDYDGERITTHCAAHCPRIQSGQREPAANGTCGGC